MPKRRKTFSNRRRRGYSVRRRRYGKTRRYTRKPKANHRATKTTISSRNVVQDKTYIKMRYQVGYVMSGSSGTPSVVVMRGNNIYDPEFATGGGQPYGFDQWAGFYQKYLVYGSKISVGFLQNNASGLNSENLQFSIVPSIEDSLSLGSTSATLWEIPYSTARISNAYKGPTRITRYMSTGKLFGLNKGEVTNREAEFGATMSSGPASEFYWHIFVGDSGQFSDWGCTINITMTYYCRLRERVLIPYS